ncbi:MAG: hypothetical protein EBY70_07890 [Burkholderiaceae bacterium]|nr:hypothetical protein [Burkholderiaceae bacterium]
MGTVRKTFINSNGKIISSNVNKFVEPDIEDDYVWMTKQLMEIANQYCEGKIVSCLEGGYNLSALGRSVAAHLKTLAEI